ncbi:MAG TPA: HD-GYP domain-containing protein [Symbiobacteriaceae bacterium]|nr:HD-GYP domain-containing protein [Symbiobacteriaceae bacterium]
MAVGWWMVNQAGGTISAVTHVMYVPIVLSAQVWGTFGGIVGGLVASGLMAITPVNADTQQMQTLTSVTLRAIAFVSVGTLVGFSVVRSRAQHREMQGLLIQSVTALTNALSINHEQTARHSLRVAEISTLLGQRLRLDENRLFALRMGSLLHDIGKLAVPLEVLDKPNRLTPDEFRTIQGHVLAGPSVLRAFDYSRIGTVQDIVRHHHERLDGSGYPDGLRGGEISLLVRIVAVADVYDALTTDRAYRRQMKHADAMGVLHQEALAGRLDHRLVEMLDRLPQEILAPGEGGTEVATEAV